MWSNSTSFGAKDAHFGKDVGFYVFDYPWLRFLTSFSFAMIVIAVIAVMFISYVFGGIRLAGRGPRFTRAAQIHLSVLLGLGVLLRAVSYYLDRFGLAVGSSALFDGIGYTDANARIPARNILIGVAIVCALLLFAAAIIRSWVLPAIGLGLLLLTSILIGGIWPFVMQSFQVKPSEPDKEGPYITRNIEATREAYDVADTKVGVLHGQDLADAVRAHAGRRSRGSAPASSTPRSSRRRSSSCSRCAATTRCPTPSTSTATRLGDDGAPQDIIIAARELNLAGLQESQRNWANDHTVYTHGYGIIAARGNERGPQGEPVWVEKDIPPTGELKIDQAAAHLLRRELARSTRSSAGRRVPIRSRSTSRAAASRPATTRRTPPRTRTPARGGVPIGNFFNRALYAFKFAEPNIVLSSRVNSASKILYDRHPRERVKKVAPWLTVDGDTYPAVVDGKVVWIVDALHDQQLLPVLRAPVAARGHGRHPDAGTLAGGAADRPGQLHAQLRQGGRRRLRRLGEALPVGHEGSGPEDLDEGLPRRRRAQERDQATAARAPALPGRHVQGAARRAARVPRHRRPDVLRGRRALEGARGPGRHRRARCSRRTTCRSACPATGRTSRRSSR